MPTPKELVDMALDDAASYAARATPVYTDLVKQEKAKLQSSGEPNQTPPGVMGERRVIKMTMGSGQERHTR